MTKSLFLEPGKENPKVFVEGRATERAKEERKTDAYSRYYKMLKDRKEKMEKEEPPEEKQPRVLRPVLPVENPQSPVIQKRE